MKRTVFIIILLVSQWLGLAKPAGMIAPWSSGTAYVLEKGRWEVGLFQPLRYGLGDSQEISIHPLICLVMPNLTYKRNWKRANDRSLATRHSIYYPTPLLKLVTREGIGGLISPEFDIPPLISIYNEVLYSFSTSDRILFTGKTGLGIGMKFGDLDERTTIDLPLVFPRLAVYYNGWIIRLGVDVTGPLFGRWNYLIDYDVFLIPGADEDFAFEHKALLLWNKSKRFQLALGYKLTYGIYPYGEQWHLLPPQIPGLPLWVPLFDLQWAW